MRTLANDRKVVARSAFQRRPTAAGRQKPEPRALLVRVALQAPMRIADVLAAEREDFVMHRSSSSLPRGEDRKATFGDTPAVSKTTGNLI
jgi:hypothetical protein